MLGGHYNPNRVILKVGNRLGDHYCSKIGVGLNNHINMFVVSTYVLVLMCIGVDTSRPLS